MVHVPKTIDNDLDLPGNIDTFGFQTARHIGVSLVGNLMVDAKTTSRWYFIISHGSQGGAPRAGHRQGRGRDADAHPRRVPPPGPSG